LKPQSLLGRQFPHFSFNGFKLAHRGSVPLDVRRVKAASGRRRAAGGWPLIGAPWTLLPA
jgi:hypothetical protein